MPKKKKRDELTPEALGVRPGNVLVLPNQGRARSLVVK